MRRSFSFRTTVAALGVAFAGFFGGPALADPPPTPSGDIYGIQFDENSFQVKSCVGGSAAVDFAFISKGDFGTVVVTVLQGGSATTRSQLVGVNGSKTSVTNFVIPEGLEGEMVFRVESASHSAPLYKQSAMNTITRHVTQVKCTLAESPSAPKEPVDTSASNNRPAYPSWLTWVLVGAGACILIGIGVIVATIRGNRWQK